MMILTDDMGYGDVTFTGKGIGLATPHIDKLASEGIRFTQFYVASPICSPSRAAIMTGRFPGRVGITTFLQTRRGNTDNEQADYLDAKVPTLPRILKSAGYATGHFGKWHLGGGRDVKDSPLISAYGYDEYSSTWESPDPDPKLGVKFAPWDVKTEPGQVIRHRRMEYMVDRTIDFMARNKTKPFFITLWPDDLHTPWRPSPEMAKKHGAAGDEAIESLRGVLEEYDRQIGRLMDNITSMGIAENTIVIFTGDNGPFPKLPGRGGELRGRKASLYEGGIREPFVVRWPGKAPAGSVNSTTVLTSVDLFPTLAKLAGATIPPEAADELNGEDLSVAFRGQSPVRSKRIFWEFGRRRRPDARNNPEISPSVAVREGNWKLFVDPDGSRRELYDVQKDPNETTNIADKNPEIAERLAKAAITWRETLPVVLRDEATSRTYVRPGKK